MAYRRWRYRERPVRRLTEASRTLTTTRVRARLTKAAVAKMMDVHARTIWRWESGETRPNAEEWSRLVACFAPFVPVEAAELARVAGVASPVAQPVAPASASSAEIAPAPSPGVDVRAIEHALLRVADVFDVAPGRVRAAVRDLLEATAAAHGTLADLLRIAQEHPGIRAVDAE